MTGACGSGRDDRIFAYPPAYPPLPLQASSCGFIRMLLPFHRLSGFLLPLQFKWARVSGVGPNGRPNVDARNLGAPFSTRALRRASLR